MNKTVKITTLIIGIFLVYLNKNITASCTDIPEIDKIFEEFVKKMKNATTEVELKEKIIKFILDDNVLSLVIPTALMLTVVIISIEIIDYVMGIIEAAEEQEKNSLNENQEQKK